MPSTRPRSSSVSEIPPSPPPTEAEVLAELDAAILSQPTLPDHTCVWLIKHAEHNTAIMARLARKMNSVHKVLKVEVEQAKAANKGLIEFMGLPANRPPGTPSAIGMIVIVHAAKKRAREAKEAWERLEREM